MNTMLKSISLAAAASLALTAHAGDKEVLDLLVKKGVVSAEERGKLLEESKAKASASGVDRVFPKEDATKRLTISGYFQTQYENFSYDDDTTAANYVAGKKDFVSQSGFLMRRLYLDILADVGEGISGNVVYDLSGNTANSIDRAMVSLSKSWGTVDVGYRKVTWGYEESTLSSLFKASSSKLLTVERGITNRYWNEQENGTRLGFGAHHTGIHYTSPANPQGLEYGLSVVNSAQGYNFKSPAGASNNDVALFANAVFNWKVSDYQKYAVGVNYGQASYWDNANTKNTTTSMAGYNPFVQAQMGDFTVYGEMMSTKLDAATGKDYTPVGYNATVAYKFNDNWEGVARYTALDTDGRGQKIGDGVRDFAKATVLPFTDAKFNKSDSVFIGVNYYFSLSSAAGAVHGPNAKIQLGYEVSNFTDGKVTNTALNTPLVGANGAATYTDATVNTIRAQFQVAF